MQLIFFSTGLPDDAEASKGGMIHREELFEIDSIDHNGNVKAGCHFIKIAQIRRIEQQVNDYVKTLKA